MFTLRRTSLDGRETQELLVRNPKFGTCCNHGEVHIPLLQEPPAPLRALFVGDDVEAEEFRKNITRYNAALAFTSLGADVDHAINRRGGSGWVFRVSGNLYHNSGALEPPPGQAPSYAQLYIYDPDVALQQRLHRKNDLREGTMAILQRVVVEFNDYAAIYKHAHEVIREHGNVAIDQLKAPVRPFAHELSYIN